MTTVFPSVKQGQCHGNQQKDADKDDEQVKSHLMASRCVQGQESIADMVSPVLWAHRGASAEAPENTMAAFAAAVDRGADGLELDIHLSGDGVPVVLHDETLDRTTNGHGPVCGKTWRQLQQLDAGSWFSDEFVGEPVPALEEVLNTFAGQLRLNLEIKEFAAGVAVLELLTLYPQADCLISSFHYPLLERLRAIDPTLPLAVLFASGNWHHALAFARGLGAIAFHPNHQQLSRPMVTACSRAGLAVHVWTVDKPAVAKSLLRAGVHGCFTNDPRALRCLITA